MYLGFWCLSAHPDNPQAWLTVVKGFWQPFGDYWQDRRDFQSTLKVLQTFITRIYWATCPCNSKLEGENKSDVFVCTCCWFMFFKIAFWVMNRWRALTLKSFVSSNLITAPAYTSTSVGRFLGLSIHSRYKTLLRF